MLLLLLFSFCLLDIFADLTTQYLFLSLFRSFLPFHSRFLYIFGLPVTSLYFLRRNRAKIKTNHPVVMFRYGLLFAGYRHKRYYWETVMAFRKVVVVAIGVFGRLTDTESQVHVALLALFMFTLMHTMLDPFPRKNRSGASVGRLETFALTCCFFTMWTGLVFYHSENQVVNQVLSIFLLVINSIFFLWGVRLFAVEFAKEQDLSMSSVADGMRLSRISTITRSMISMRRKSSVTLFGNLGNEASRQGGGSSANEEEVKTTDLGKATVLYEDKETKVFGNPLLQLQPRKHASGQRSLMKSGTSFRRRARRSGTADVSDTRFGDTNKAKTQMRKIALIRQKVSRKEQRRRRREQEESGGIEMTTKTTQIECDKLSVDEDTDAIQEKERELYQDEESGRYYYVDEETGVSHWYKDNDDDKGDETTEVTTKKKEKRELHPR